MAVKKRFYKSVTIEKSAGFWRVQLDGRDLKSPAGTLLSLPTSDLASAIADVAVNIGPSVTAEYIW